MLQIKRIDDSMMEGDIVLNDVKIFTFVFTDSNNDDIFTKLLVLIH